MSYWTTEQVAEYLGVDVAAVYDSRRSNEFPGNRGTRRGRRLMFPSEAIEEGRRAVEEGRDPDEGRTTNDVNTAILWTLQGIEAKLAAILKELERQRPQYFSGDLLETTEIVESAWTGEEE